MVELSCINKRPVVHVGHKRSLRSPASEECLCVFNLTWQQSTNRPLVQSCSISCTNLRVHHTKRASRHCCVECIKPSLVLSAHRTSSPRPQGSTIHQFCLLGGVVCYLSPGSQWVPLSASSSFRLKGGSRSPELRQRKLLLCFTVDPNMQHLITLKENLADCFCQLKAAPYVYLSLEWCHTGSSAFTMNSIDPVQTCYWASVLSDPITSGQRWAQIWMQPNASRTHLMPGGNGQTWCCPLVIGSLRMEVNTRSEQTSINLPTDVPLPRVHW